MKIGILTHYQVESHGACLQHYAMTQQLKNMGHEIYTLSYRKNMDFATSSDQKKFNVGIGSIPFYIREYLFKKGPSFVWTMYKKHIGLSKFNRKNFCFKHYATANLDLAVVGSDEVWSLQLGPNIMMYGHGIDATRVISYAPSFGQTDIPLIEEKHCLPLISSGLSSFSALSARDVKSKEIAQQLTGRDVTLVCDPVLLYGFEQELTQFHPMTKEKYVVVYGYNSNMNEPDRIENIKTFAKKNGAKVYSVGAFHRWCDKQISCDPIEMIYWFKGAQAVFTDTFHGTITAYLSKVPLAVYIRSTNNVKLNHLLQLLGLESRQVTDERNIEQIMSEPIDYDQLHKEFEPIRAQSADYLRNALVACSAQEG